MRRDVASDYRVLKAKDFDPEIDIENNSIHCKVNLDDQSFRFEICNRKAGEFIHATCWETYAGDDIYSGHFETLDQAVFACSMASVFRDHALFNEIANGAYSPI